ncbi:MAG: pyridoxamine 5'-phosphate oxidase family protein [Bacteroidales bacterium]|nr:pyridoxamine 5'-phosphate oxidase family protein [Bacteroidales bacterium]
MKNSISISEYIQNVLQTSKLAVLATEGEGQPYASLIVITPVSDFKQMIFATYRNTRKFENLLNNGRVAVLIQGEESDMSFKQSDYALTAFGHAQQVCKADYEEALQKHLKRHPDQANYMLNADLALMLITIEKFQVVRGFDDVSWWSVDDSRIL